MLPTTLIFWTSPRRVSIDSLFISPAGPGIRSFPVRVCILSLRSWWVLTGGPSGVSLGPFGPGFGPFGLGSGVAGDSGVKVLIGISSPFSPKVTIISLSPWRTIFKLYLFSLSLFICAIFILIFSSLYSRAFFTNEVDMPSGLSAMSEKNCWRSGLLIVDKIISVRVFNRIWFTGC